MIDEKAIKYCEETFTTTGCTYLMTKTEQQAGKFDFGRRFKNLNNVDLRMTINECRAAHHPISSVGQLLYWLDKHVTDPDTKAQIYGYRDAAHEKAYRERVHDLAERMARGEPIDGWLDDSCLD